MTSNVRTEFDWRTLGRMNSNECGAGPEFVFVEGGKIVDEKEGGLLGAFLRLRLYMLCCSTPPFVFSLCFLHSI